MLFNCFTPHEEGAKSVNKAIILGRLGKDPELKHTPGGIAVCEFSIATSHKVKTEEITEWHNVVCFNKQAENCAKYLKKGRECMVEGRIKTTSWDDKATGAKRSKVQVIASVVQWFGPNSWKDDSFDQSTPPVKKVEAVKSFTSEDIPF